MSGCNTYALQVILSSDLQTAPVFPLYKAREGSQGQSFDPIVENVPLAKGGAEDTRLSLSELLDAEPPILGADQADKYRGV